MDSEAQRQKAIEVASKAIHDARCREAYAHSDYAGCVMFYKDHATLAVSALIDAGMLCSHDLDAVETKLWRRYSPSANQDILLGIQLANGAWRAALSGSAPTRTETP